MDFENLMRLANESQKKIVEGEKQRRFVSLEVKGAKKLEKKVVDSGAVARLLGGKQEEAKKKVADDKRVARENATRLAEAREMDVQRRKRPKKTDEYLERERQRLKQRKSVYDEIREEDQKEPTKSKASGSSKGNGSPPEKKRKKEKPREREVTPPVKPKPKREVTPPVKPKPKHKDKPKAPPVMSYSQLMAIAQAGGKQEKAEAGPRDRPLSAVEKAERERKQTKEYKEYIRTGKKLPKPHDTSPAPPGVKPGGSRPHGSPSPDPGAREKHRSSKDKDRSEKHRHDKERSDKHKHDRERSDRHKLDKERSDKHRLDKHKSSDKEKSKHSKSDNGVKAGSSSSDRRDNNNHSEGKGKHKKEEKKKVALPPAPKVSAWDAVMNKYHDKPGRGAKGGSRHGGRRVLDSDSEEEYDSEMDDFIDDGDDQDNEYSSVIAQIFKYDRRKYRGMDEDVDNMEAGYADIAAEERRSAKIGLKEDMADIKAEEQRQKIKMLKKKRLK